MHTLSDVVHSTDHGSRNYISATKCTTLEALLYRATTPSPLAVRRRGTHIHCILLFFVSLYAAFHSLEGPSTAQSII